MALIVTDALKFRESENDQFRRLSLSANFNTPVPVSQGGTGATTAAQAAKNLNVLHLGEVVTKIPSGADLNNYTTPGVYAVHSTAIAQTLMNKPVDMAGTLRVFCSNGADINSVSSKYIIQEYIHLQGPKYYRFGASEAGAAFTWDAWQFAGPSFAKHALIPCSSFTSTNGTIWGTESYLDIWWDNQKVIMSGYILLKDVSAGILRVVFRRPAGLPAFNILIGGETFRRGANGSMLAGDFCYISNSDSNEIIAERNMFTNHPAADYARIDINCAIGFF